MRTRWTKWETQHGKYIRVKDMGDNHLLNAHRFMRRESIAASRYGAIFDFLGGKVTWAAYGEDIESACESWINCFAGEVRRRGLKEKA